MNCLVCASPTRRGLVDWHRTCPSCRYEAADLQPRINAAATRAHLNESDREEALRALRQQNFQTILRDIRSKLEAPAMGKKSRLLDVGCAHGWFLDLADGHFTVLGIEPDIEMAERARTRGLPIRAGYFPCALMDDERFDVIVFNDVLEHVPDIHAALRACYLRLHPGGLLVLNLPSSRGVLYRLSKLLWRLGVRGPFRRMWQVGLPSPHVHYFNLENLSSLLARHGFRLVSAFTLPALHGSGLRERVRFAGPVHPVSLQIQVVLLRCLMPLLGVLPSDIQVAVFRKPGCYG